eukprot:2719416-Rhodomonas_salina.5
MAVTAQRQLYVFGGGEEGQLGSGASVRSRRVPTLLGVPSNYRAQAALSVFFKSGADVFLVMPGGGGSGNGCSEWIACDADHRARSALQLGAQLHWPARCVRRRVS